MSFASIIIFIFGTFFGALVLFLILFPFNGSSVNHILKDRTFFGATIKSDVVETKKNLKLYQNGKEIGTLLIGTQLEKTLHVDKIDHYTLNIIFEPFSYENPQDILETKDERKNFSVTDLIYMDED